MVLVVFLCGIWFVVPFTPVGISNKIIAFLSILLGAIILGVGAWVITKGETE